MISLLCVYMLCEYAVCIQKTFSAMCSADMKLTFAHVGAPGSVGDCGVFQRSGLGPYIEKNLPSGWHILGDSAFPIREWLLTPYKHTLDLEEGKRMFNYQLSKVRMTIERCFD